jgi:broad specificity phosphatase PhoE
MSEKYTEIFLVRHGETYAKTNENELGLPYVCGSGSRISRNTHLTENGKQQMFGVGEKYKYVTFDVVVISDLVRSRESALAFLDGAGQNVLQAQIIENPNITEIDYGQDDGVSEEKIKEKKKNFFSDPNKTAVEYDTLRGGETFEQAGKRMKNALTEIAQTYPNKKVLIISHSGAMRAFAGNIVVSQDLKFGEVMRIKANGENLEIIS